MLRFDSVAPSTAEVELRIARPGEAAHAGADLLVVGRPITASADPKAEVMAIVAEAGT